MHAREERGAGARVVSRAFARQGQRCLVRQPAEYQDLVPERSQRREDLRQLVPGPFDRRSPFAHDDPVRNVDNPQAHRRRGFLRARERRNHRVEHR